MKKTPYMVAKENRNKKIARLIYERMIESASSNKDAKENAKPVPEVSIVTINDEICTTMEILAKNCVICHEAIQEMFAFQPCGHAKTCKKCTMRILATSQPCPMCRRNVTRYQKIFD